jgi:cytosine/adenosine deaminase-related metal-dependent hydrolase
MHAHRSGYSPFCPSCLVEGEGQGQESRRGFLRALGLMSAVATAPILQACGGAAAAPVEVQNNQRPASLLIKNAYVATADASRRVIRDGAVYILNGEIKMVGDTAAVVAVHPTAERVIDAAGKLVMPGFFNTHWHATHIFRQERYDDDIFPDNESSFDRGGEMLGVSGALEQFLTAGAALQITPEEAYVLVAAQLLPMLRAGTTTVTEMTGPFGDVLPQVAIDLGMRVMPAYSLFDRALGAGNTVTPVGNTQTSLVAAEAFINTWRNHSSGLVHPWVAYAYSVMVSDDMLRGVKTLADRYSLAYGGHTAALANEVAFTQAAYGATPIDRLDNLGLLSSRFMGTHMTWMSDSELAKVAAARSSISLATAKYAQSGENTISGGVGVKALRQGVNVCLGTDGSGWNDSPMPTHMHFAMMLNEAGNDSSLVQSLAALEMGTINSAKAVSMDTLTGSLTAGKRADITIADISDLRYVEASDVMHNFVANAGMKDIETVIVDGRIVVENNAVRNLSEAEVARKFKDVIGAVRARLG